ncbi:uncharacterized protein BDV14DRAFT_198943 [Aspergillus stella-maris]|uniref:uncharacterized protein n=1 Tax=Aspergillus stella-maris TaxID=1810926 RepID=UPI003CCCD1D8
MLVTVFQFSEGVVSGIKRRSYFHARIRDDNDNACIVGYHDPSIARWMDIPSDAAIREMHVRFARIGIIGIMFRFSSGNDSGWIGALPGDGVDEGILRLDDKPGPRYLYAGVDIYKMVKLGICDPKDETNTPTQPPSSSLTADS